MLTGCVGSWFFNSASNMVMKSRDVKAAKPVRALLPLPAELLAEVFDVEVLEAMVLMDESFRRVFVMECAAKQHQARIRSRRT